MEPNGHRPPNAPHADPPCPGRVDEAGPAGRAGPSSGASGPSGTRADGGPVTARQVTRRLASVAGGVAESPSRGAAEATACEELVGSGLYRSAWVGVRAPDRDGVAVRASAGIDGDCRDAVETAIGVADAPAPWGRAFRTGAVETAPAGDLASDPWPLDGEGSVAAVPLGPGDAVDGVLAVVTSRRAAFGELERAGLDALGTTLGLAVDAVRSRDLFFADSVVELELRTADDASPLVRASDVGDCRVTLVGYAAEGDRWRVYCDVTGSDREAFADRVAADPVLTGLRTVVDRTDGCRLALEATDLPLVERSVAAGATVEAAVADHGVCRATLGLPRSGDVPETVARLRTTFPDLEFLSRRDVDRGPATPTAPAGVFDDLTDRQREALEAAFRAGYFEWPRENTAEEVAPDLGITSSTLHRHLREAERRLLATLFD